MKAIAYVDGYLDCTSLGTEIATMYIHSDLLSLSLCLCLSCYFAKQKRKNGKYGGPSTTLTFPLSVLVLVTRNLLKIVRLRWRAIRTRQRSSQRTPNEEAARVRKGN